MEFLYPFYFCTLILLLLTRSAIIVTQSFGTPGIKCYGNFVSLGFRCVPCQSDEIARENRCVKMLAWGYGSNLNSFSLSGITGPINGLPFCKKINAINSKECSQCLLNYDLINGKCIEQSCKIYSQILTKCVDDLKATEIQALHMQNSPVKNETALVQAIYIVGGPMSKMQVMLIDNILSLTIPTLSLKLNNTELQQNEVIIIGNTGSSPQIMKNSEGNICKNFEDEICKQCIRGYLLNILSNQCVMVSEGINFTQSSKIGREGLQK